MSNSPAPTLVEAYEWIKAGDQARAGQILKAYLADHPDDPQAWWLMAHAINEPEMRRKCLERVLKLDPNHQKAREKLGALLKSALPPTVELAATFVVPPDGQGDGSTVPSVDSSDSPTPSIPAPKPAVNLGTGLLRLLYQDSPADQPPSGSELPDPPGPSPYETDPLKPGTGVLGFLKQGAPADKPPVPKTPVESVAPNTRSEVIMDDPRLKSGRGRSQDMPAVAATPQPRPEVILDERHKTDGLGGFLTRDIYTAPPDAPHVDPRSIYNDPGPKPTPGLGGYLTRDVYAEPSAESAAPAPGGEAQSDESDQSAAGRAAYLKRRTMTAEMARQEAEATTPQQIQVDKLLAQRRAQKKSDRELVVGFAVLTVALITVVVALLWTVDRRGLVNLDGLPAMTTLDSAGFSLQYPKDWIGECGTGPANDPQVCTISSQKRLNILPMYLGKTLNMDALAAQNPVLLNAMDSQGETLVAGVVMNVTSSNIMTSIYDAKGKEDDLYDEVQGGMGTAYGDELKISYDRRNQNFARHEGQYYQVQMDVKTTQRAIMMGLGSITGCYGSYSAYVPHGPQLLWVQIDVYTAQPCSTLPTKTINHIMDSITLK